MSPVTGIRKHPCLEENKNANARSGKNSPQGVQRSSEGRKRGGKLKRILEETKPEAVYFTEHDGQRGALLIVNLADPAKVPSIAEPWFLSFNADVEFRIAMTPEDLGHAGLDALGKKWA